MTTSRATLTPDHWIGAATEVLIRSSVDAVRVDVLARTLAVTRGSFYWHFSDRDDLLQRVLQAWQAQQTEGLISRWQRQGVAAAALVDKLVALPFHGRAAMRGAAIELAIRAWARHDDMARTVVDAVDAQRLAYIEGCFAALDFPAADARSRAFLLYCYMQSESLFRNQGSAEDKTARREFVARLLLKAT